MWPSRAGFLALSLFSCTRASVPERPEVSYRVTAPELSPEEVEKTVVVPLEQAARVDGVRQVRTLSLPGRAVVTAVFDAKADISSARVAMQARLAGVKLPAGAHGDLDPKPGAAFVRFVMSSDSLDSARLREQAREIRRSLLHVDGVEEVETCGGAIAYVDVALDPSRLSAHGLALQSVTDALVRATRIKGMPLSSRAFRSIGELSTVVVEDAGGITVRDLGTLAMRTEQTACTAFGRGGTRVVSGTVLLREAAKRPEVTAKLDELRRKLSADTTLVLVEDSAVHLRVNVADESEAPVTIARSIMDVPGALDVLVETGDAGWASRRLPGDVDLRIRAEAGQEAAVLAALRTRLRSSPGISSARSPNSASTNMLFLNVLGDDLDSLGSAAAGLETALAPIPGVAAIGSRGTRSNTASSVQIDTTALARFGIAREVVERQIEAVSRGTVAGRMMEASGRTFDVRVRLDAEAKDGGFTGLTIAVPTGTPVPLSAFATLRSRAERVAIFREDGVRYVTVWVEIEEQTSNEASEAVRRKAEQYPLPDGVRLRWRTPR